MHNSTSCFKAQDTRLVFKTTYGLCCPHCLEGQKARSERNKNISQILFKNFIVSIASRAYT